jgi:hypothetical protein
MSANAIVKAPANSLSQKEVDALDSIASDAKKLQASCDGLLRDALAHTWEAGKMLSKARDILSASKGWTAWQKKNGISETWANEAIRVFAKYPAKEDLKKFKHITEAKVFAGISKPKRKKPRNSATTKPDSEKDIVWMDKPDSPMKGLILIEETVGHLMTLPPSTNPAFLRTLADTLAMLSIIQRKAEAAIESAEKPALVEKSRVQLPVKKAA